MTLIVATAGHVDALPIYAHEDSIREKIIDTCPNISRAKIKVVSALCFIVNCLCCLVLIVAF